MEYLLENIRLTLAALLFALPIGHAVYHQTIKTTDTEAKTIKSEGYPGAYPTDVNITWHWHTETGQWAVVFFDFVLDKDIIREEDWLEIEDGDRRLRYTNTTPPLKDLITEGPHLSMRFISDDKTNPKSRGFRILVLFGETDSELHLKIHEARKLEEQKNRGKDDDTPGPLLIILATTLLVLLLIIVIGVVGFIMYRRRHHQNSFTFDTLPRIRRDSGVSHTRSIRQETQDNVQNNNHQQQLQQEQQQFQQQQQQVQQQHPQVQQLQDQTRRPSRTSRTSRGSQQRQGSIQTSGEPAPPEDYTGRGQRPSVQRSNSNTSQMNWIVRAELSTALQTADRRSKPNLYTNAPEVNTSKTRKSSSTSSINSNGVTVPYVDVLTPIPDQPSDISQQHTSDNYDNFEAVFNNTFEAGPDYSLDQTCGSCDNLYTNTYAPPAYESDLGDSESTDKKEQFYSLGRSVPPRRAGDSMKTPIKNDQKAEDSGDILYVNLNLSSSQKDIRSQDGGGVNQGENEIYGNIAIGLSGRQTTALVSVSSDNPSFCGSDSSLNKIVLNVNQDPRKENSGRAGGSGGVAAAGGDDVGASTAPTVTLSAMKRKDSRQEDSIYDIPPPNRLANDTYFNLSDMKMAPTGCSGDKQTVKKATLMRMNTSFDAVIPVTTSKQDGASPLYDVPKSSRN